MLDLPSIIVIIENNFDCRARFLGKQITSKFDGCILFDERKREKEKRRKDKFFAGFRLSTALRPQECSNPNVAL